jgi:transcriptional regulator GlxA family with amidase domain
MGLRAVAVCLYCSSLQGRDLCTCFYLSCCVPPMSRSGDGARRTRVKPIVLALPFAEFQLRLARLVEELGVDKVSLGSIAHRLVMPPKTLARRFRMELDVTPGKWLQTVRISKAREYLEASALSVGEICDRIGYGDQASFTRLFGRITGLTPTEYRRQMRL